MNSTLESMLQAYNTRSLMEQKHAAKEIVQELVLCGLSRAGFFDHAAFYGGTALRIFYGLDRFSEDMDFSLMTPNEEFDLTDFFPVLETELRSYGLNMKIEKREKTVCSDIQSAFLKGNTREHLLLLFPQESFSTGVPRDEKIKIKFEVDVNPPALATFERRYQLLPAPYEVNLYDRPSLFAGKIHAVLCRGWKNRVKGRDLYDYLFYLARNTKVNLPHLQERLVQTGHWDSRKTLTVERLRQLLAARFDIIDYKAAAHDVEPFLSDRSSLTLWSSELFNQVSEQLEAV
ncbi:nucleotidyl transferase AbiEii/AbiGii toxin family protein [Adlercreutzia sp. ZJ138]|uniref:nucleotidyl transferase AbiEii/AbiGii toxin family protein n=1 Tax=Adlercreutzia sp. ZJ138 TaxID=2709405 RepID=UPI0013EC1FF3|nr:nucleotidyl transferase AbiEii/AbiGii toxin family protein [Adlercreutzia sp. ZJ138]